MAVLAAIETVVKAVKVASKVLETVSSSNLAGTVVRRLTYKLLRNTSYGNLIKMGFTPEKILEKLTNFYLKEGRQLTIPRVLKDGKSVFDYKALAKAVNELNKGRVRMGKIIDITMQTQNKLNIKVLKQLTSTYGEDSFAKKLYSSYQAGEINVYQLNKSVHTYVNNIAEYEADFEKYREETKSILQPLIEGYNA